MSTPYTESLKTGTPLASGTVLADTGALSANTYSAGFWISANGVTTVRFERRNANNDGNIWSHTFYVDALNPVLLTTLIGLAVDTDERFRIVLGAAFVGSAQATLFI